MATTPDLATIRQAYVTYADYEAEGSQASCKAFVTACRRLIVMLPSESEAVGVSRVQFQIAEVRRQLELAQTWLAAHPSAADAITDPAVLDHDFSAFTDRD
jgi:cobalamin-dependent methionine synthase I